MIKLRLYKTDDWDTIATIHDRARLDELRVSVGTNAFLSLADTAETEGLFEGEIWVACGGETVVGFVAFADSEVTWLYVAPTYYRQGIGRMMLPHSIAHGPVLCDRHCQTDTFALVRGGNRAIAFLSGG